MSRRAKITDTNGRLSVIESGDAKAGANGATVSETELTDAVSTRDVDEILVAVLRVFAARGRAIREERAKLEAARLLDAGATEVSADQLGPSNPEKNAKTQVSG